MCEELECLVLMILEFYFCWDFAQFVWIPKIIYEQLCEISCKIYIVVLFEVELFTAKSEAFHSTHKMRIIQLHEGVYFRAEYDLDTLDLSFRIREPRNWYFFLNHLEVMS